ncbi:MAG: hypothetical protein NTZ56_23240 [Acidobacteria bacterium]|nr:hypothetical protein [Acidobacteriota bacterium]
MAKEALVDIDVVRGRELLDALDQAKVPVPVAFWLRNEEYDEWRLILATPWYGPKGSPNPFLDLARAIPHKDHLIDDLHVALKTMQNPLIKSLRSIFGRTKSVEGMRLGAQMIGGIWVDDAYVYRIK